MTLWPTRAVAHLQGQMGRDDLHTTSIGGNAFDEMVALTGRLGLDEVVAYLAMGRPLVSFDAVAERSDVRITFDDGKASDVGVALPRLVERSLTAEFFLLAGVLGAARHPTHEDAPYGDRILYVNFAGPARRAAESGRALFQTRRACTLMAKPCMRRLSGAKLLNMVPGNIYLFWGYRTLHADEPCLPSSLRATGLFHAGDPHRNSRRMQRVQQARNGRAAREWPHVF